MTSELRNLVMLYKPGALDPTDFEEIADKISDTAPDIEVLIGKTDAINPMADLSRKAAQRPSLIFSPGPLRAFRPLRGSIFCGRRIAKIEQMERLKKAGIPVPEWKVIAPGVKLRPSRWGKVMVVKPTAWGAATFSHGIKLERTESIVFRPLGEFPVGHPGREGPMVAQRFVDTGPRPAQMRVLTLFGTPLYAEEIKAEHDQMISHDSSHEAPSEVSITPVTQARVRAFVYDEQVLDLAARAAAVFPHVPLLGIDILKEAATGMLYVLEVNPGGNVWHFSSRWGGTQRVEGKKRQEQFDAFRRAADILVRQTRLHAR